MNEKEVMDISKTFETILKSNNEDFFYEALTQTSAFVDQLLISVGSDDFSKQELLKNLVNLRSFIESSTFNYKVKKNILSLVEDKKKEKDLKKESENQKENSRLDPLN